MCLSNQWHSCTLVMFEVKKLNASSLMFDVSVGFSHLIYVICYFYPHQHMQPTQNGQTSLFWLHGVFKEFQNSPQGLTTRSYHTPVYDEWNLQWIMFQSCLLVLDTSGPVMMTVWVSSTWQAVSMETLPREHLVARQHFPIPSGEEQISAVLL